MVKKRILFITYEYPPLGGGVAIASKALIEEFSHYNNLKVDVITSSLDNTWKSKEIYPNVTFHSIPIGKKPTSTVQHQTLWNMIKFTINSTRKIRELVSENDFDLAHFFGYPGAWPGLLFKSKLPYIISLRGADVPGYNQKFGLYYHLYKPFTKLSWKHAAGIIANSQWLKDLALKTWPEADISIIPNGVDTTLFKPLPESKKYTKFTITAGGTLMNPKKNLDIVINAFALFHQNHPNSQLVLFGSGPLEMQLKKQVIDLNLQNSVIFKGRVTQKELARELPKCHVFCLPSSAEGMSNAMLEALASGLPIITTNVGAAADIINNNGIILAATGTNSILDAIKKVFHSQVKRLKMGRQSRSIAEKLSWLNTADKYLSLYHKTISKS